METKGLNISSVETLKDLVGTEKLPVGNGGEKAVTVTVNQLKEFINKEVDTKINAMKQEIIKSIPSLSGYAKESWVTNEITTATSDLAKKSDVKTKLSELTNDANFITDPSYVHTDNNYTTEDKQKLASLGGV